MPAGYNVPDTSKSTGPWGAFGWLLPDVLRLRFRAALSPPAALWDVIFQRTLPFFAFEKMLLERIIARLFRSVKNKIFVYLCRKL